MSRIRADRYTNREGTGAPTFSEGVNVVGVTSMSGDFVLTNGTITGPSQLTISGITSSISDTAADVFVYDTSKDSDGGAWRKRTQNTSWYNETLNTATRGSRKEFPAVAVIVLDDLTSTGRMTIYDGDDPDLPMWMVFTGGVSAAEMLPSFGATKCICLSALNGQICVGNNTYDLEIIDFLKDGGTRIAAAQYINKHNISTRNSALSNSASSTGSGLVNRAVNDVAMTVLPNAPVDIATGLPVPTIAVATDGGVSIIRDDGKVSNITYSSYVTIGVSFDKNNGLWLGYQVGTTAIGWYYYTSLETTSALPTTGPNCNNGWSGSFNMTGGSNFTGLGYNYSDFAAGTVDKLHNFNGFGNVGAPTKLVNYISTTYNTGWVPGDIQLATLSDTDATSQTGGTIADRSVKANSLTVTGTITRTAVATGADLVAYSGFSANNVLVQPYNANLNPGTGDYSFTFWFKCPATTAEQQYMRRFGVPTVTGGMMMRLVASTSVLQWYVRDTSSAATTVQSVATVDDDVWHFAVGTRQGSVANLYIDGVLVNTSTCSANSHDPGTTADLVIGAEEVAASPGTYQNPADLSSMALIRYSLSVPSAEQVKKMYDDEKYLFQENSQATLYGSSDTVTALAYDDSTNILHVGTSSGRSDFQGLRRINNTTVGITTAISASNELVAEQ